MPFGVADTAAAGEPAAAADANMDQAMLDGADVTGSTGRCWPTRIATGRREGMLTDNEGGAVYEMLLTQYGGESSGVAGRGRRDAVRALEPATGRRPA